MSEERLGAIGAIVGEKRGGCRQRLMTGVRSRISPFLVIKSSKLNVRSDILPLAVSSCVLPFFAFSPFLHELFLNFNRIFEF